MSEKLNNDQKRIVLENMRLVHFVVRKICVYEKALEYDDFVSIGTIGLIDAVKTFDPLKGYTFSSYATKCIRNKIILSFKKSKKSENNTSIDEQILSSDEGDIVTLGDTLKAPDSDFDKKILDKEVFTKVISIVLNYLNGNNRIIMLYRMANISGSKIGKMLKCTRNNISAIELRVIAKIREVFNKNIHYEEVFFMEVKGDVYEISVLIKDSDNLNNKFITFLQDLAVNEDSQDYKIYYNKKRVVI